MKLKWIFFDIGWTLVDETNAHFIRFEKLRQWLHSIGVEFTISEMIERCEQAASDYAESPFLGFLDKLELTNKQASIAKGNMRYAKEKERLYLGVPTLLDKLHRSYRLGIIANQSVGTEARLRNWKIKELFSIVFTSAELGLSKPDPRIFEQALSQTGCEPEEALMVGDRLDNDISPANMQGWMTARVLQGFARFQKPRNTYEIPDVILSQLTDLPQYLY